MFIDVTNYAYEDLQALYTAGLLYFTRRSHPLPVLFDKPHVYPERPNFESRIHTVGQRFYIRLEE